VYLLIPVVLSILTATFEGISVGLLIPLVKGTLTMDFRFMTTMKGISTVLDWLPADITSSNKLLLTLLICLFVVTVVLKNITRYGSVLTMTRFAYRSAHYLRRMIFARYLSFGKLYFDRTSVGHHTTVLSAFTDLALRPLLSVDKYMNALFSLITYLAVMCTISWKLTLFAAPLFLVLHWSVRTVIVHIRRISQKVASTASELGRKSIEILSTLPLVTSYNMQDSENRHYGRISDEMSHALFRTTRYQEIIRPIQELETMVAILLLLVAMLWLSANGEGIESSSFIVYFYLVVNASSKFGILTNFRSGMAGAVGPLEQVTKVFDEDMIESEYESIFEITKLFYGIFGLEYSYRLGTRPESFMGDVETWNSAEESLKKILEKSGLPYTIAQGDGAFYGPKVDILMKDAIGREWQMGTIQLDFQQPRRFGLEYVAEDGSRKTPVAVHRVIYGSLERFIGLLIEHYAGSFPLWLSPVQLSILPISDNQLDYAKKVRDELQSAYNDLRIEIDGRAESIGKKIREATLQKIPYQIIVGEKEVAANVVAVRTRSGEDLGQISVEDFAKKISDEILGKL
jgi:ABC-type multidrug transport system fused ATPase/permease subunit